MYDVYTNGSLHGVCFPTVLSVYLFENLFYCLLLSGRLRRVLLSNGLETSELMC